MNHVKGFAQREMLPGQKGGKLYPIHCNNPECGINKKLNINFRGVKLLGRFYAGTTGEIKCSRCGRINIFTVREDARA